jgi:hypothetical protein
MGLSEDLYEHLAAEDKRIRRVLLIRYMWRIFHKRNADYRAPRFVPGVRDQDDPRRQPREKQLREAGYSNRAILELAVGEVVDNETEKIYRHGYGNDPEDFTHLLGKDELSLADRDELVTFLADLYQEEARRFRESDEYKEMVERRAAKKRGSTAYYPKL